MTHDPHKNAGKKIKYLRQQADETATRLAEKLGVGLQDLHMWEKGIGRPPDDVLEKVAKLYGVGLGYFEDKPKGNEKFLDMETAKVVTAFGGAPKFQRTKIEEKRIAERVAEDIRQIKEMDELKHAERAALEAPPAILEDASAAAKAHAEREEKLRQGQPRAREGLAADFDAAVGSSAAAGIKPPASKEAPAGRGAPPREAKAPAEPPPRVPSERPAAPARDRPPPARGPAPAREPDPVAAFTGIPEELRGLVATPPGGVAPVPARPPSADEPPRREEVAPAPRPSAPEPPPAPAAEKEAGPIRLSEVTDDRVLALVEVLARKGYFHAGDFRAALGRVSARPKP